MSRPRALDYAGLSVLIALEAWLFTGAFDKFFNHDSLFYLIHAPKSWSEALTILGGPDPSLQYRPLTLIFMGFVVPWAGTATAPYHWIPLIFHPINTGLFYLLARRLLRNSWEALAAAGFWGLHSVAGWITYDTTYLSDFMMAAFLTGSLVLVTDGVALRSRLRIVLALVLFAGGLLSKEAAVTFPLAVLLCLVLQQAEKGCGNPGGARIRHALKNALPVTAMFLAAALVHAAVLYRWMKSGALYTQGPTAAYHIDLWSNLSAKLRYFTWAFNLPDSLQTAHPGRDRLFALLLMGSLLALWLYYWIRRKGLLDWSQWSGMIWLAGMNVPAFLLANRTAKWYLYVPVMGVAIMFGAFAGSMRDRIGPHIRFRGSGALIAGLLLLPVVFSTRVQTRSFLNSSDSAYSSQVVQNCVQDLRRVYPRLPDPAQLYVLPTFETNVADFFGGGRLYDLFYPGTRIKMLFADKGNALPQDYFNRPGLLILQYLYGHVDDSTAYYKGRLRSAEARPLVERLEDITATVSRDEYYLSYETFQTPGGTPVFFPTPDRTILTQIGGSTVRVPVRAVPPASALRFDISWMFDAGDGGWAEIRFRAGEREHLLYRRRMNPNPPGTGPQWTEVNLDLGRFALAEGEVLLRCFNSPGATTLADWLNWRGLAIEPAAGRNSPGL